MPAHSHKQTWLLDQLARSLFFHQTLHEWALLEVQDRLQQVKGDTLKWDLLTLKIAEPAWNKIIHQGIKPVTVFAHPDVLQQIPRSVGYYRMLAMLSQKSMARIGLAVVAFEHSDQLPGSDTALALATQLNAVICQLIEADNVVDERELLLWRGMAAGTQAQGSWQNVKGDQAERLIKCLILTRLTDKALIAADQAMDTNERRPDLPLLDGRVLRFADEPDVAVIQNDQAVIVVEVNGGIDSAGVLERIGAALKSLRRAKDQRRPATTILLMQRASFTAQASADLQSNRSVVDHWFAIEDIVESTAVREQFFALLGL